jgi:hypothetical protein
MIASPALRDRDMAVTADVAHSFVAEMGLQAASTTMRDNLSFGLKRGSMSCHGSFYSPFWGAGVGEWVVNG